MLSEWRCMGIIAKLGRGTDKIRRGADALSKDIGMWRRLSKRNSGIATRK